MVTMLRAMAIFEGRESNGRTDAAAADCRRTTENVPFGLSLSVGQQFMRIAKHTQSSVSFFVLLILVVVLRAEMIIHLYCWTFIAVFYCVRCAKADHENTWHICMFKKRVASRGHLGFGCSGTVKCVHAYAIFLCAIRLLPYLDYLSVSLTLDISRSLRSKLPTSLFPAPSGKSTHIPLDVCAFLSPFSRYRAFR